MKAPLTKAALRQYADGLYAIALSECMAAHDTAGSSQIALKESAKVKKQIALALHAMTNKEAPTTKELK